MSIRSSYRERISGRKDIENELQDSNKQEYDVDEAEQLLFSDDSEKIKYFFDNFRRFENLNKKIAYKMIHLEVSNLIFENEEKFPGLIFDKKFAIEMINFYQSQVVIANLEKFVGLDKEIAYTLISDDNGMVVIENRDKFLGLDFDNELAKILLRSDQSEVLFYYIEKFTDFDRDFAGDMIYYGFGIFVIENIEIFNGLELDEELALLFIDRGGHDVLMRSRERFVGINFNKDFLLKAAKYRNYDFFIDYIDQFVGLDKEIALALIDGSNTECVILNKDKFAGLELNKELAMFIIEKQQIRALADNINKFNNLDKEIAIVLIEAGYEGQVIVNKDKFAGLELNKELALFIIEKQQICALADNINKFNNLDKEIAIVLIEAGHTDRVIENKDKFAGLELNKEIAMLLIEKKQAHVLVYSLNKFDNLDKEVALALVLVEAGYVGQVVIVNKDKFAGLELNKELAILLIETKQEKYLVNNINKFNNLDKEVALSLIKAGYAGQVIVNKDKFAGLELNKELAMFIIEKKQTKYLANNLDSFNDLDKEITLALIEAGHTDRVIENKDKFAGLELNKEIAMILIEKKQAKILVDSLNKFNNLDKEVAKALIEAGYAGQVIVNKDKFVGLELNKELAMLIIEKKQTKYLANNLDSFNDLDKEITLALIVAGHMDCVIDDVYLFEGLEFNKELAILLIETKQAGYLVNNINKFYNLDKEIALSLIEVGYAGNVIVNKDKFAGLEFNKELAMLLIETKQSIDLLINSYRFNDLDKEIALLLIEAGQAEGVFYHRDEFKGFELNKELALFMIETKQVKDLSNNLDSFNDLDKEIALVLIGARYTGQVISNAYKFTGFELNKELALFMIETKQSEYLVFNLKKFNDLDKEIALVLIGVGYIDLVIDSAHLFAGLELNKELAILLIETKQEKYLVNNINKFNNLDKEVALSLIKAGHGNRIIAIADEDRFAGLEFNKELAMLLIEFGCADKVSSFEDKFAGLELNKEIAMFIIGKKQASALIQNIDKFNNLDKEVALALIEAGQIDLVMGNKEKFAGLEFNKEIAILIIEKRYSQVFLSNADKFFGIDREVIIIILKNKEGNILCNFLKNESVKKMLGYELIPEALYEKSLTTIKIILQANVFPMLCQEDFELLFNEKNSIQKTLSNFSVLELNVLAEQNKLQNLKWLGSEEECEGIFKKLKENGIDSWSDEHNISGPFERGSAIFGYKKMFSYILREGVSRHDMLYNFDKIIKLFKISGLEAQQFYIQILDQVKRDGAEYDGGKSVHHLNTIANNFRGDISKVLQEAQEYGDIKGLQTLVKDLSTPEQIFKSWESLKKYAELCQLLGKKEILGQLKQLKSEGEGKEKLYKYIERLAFHPDISMQSVIQFWRNPEAFLGLLDIHTDVILQNRKKPSNYIEIPNLDLTAEQLRDALVEGSLDQIQVFEPLEIEYELPARSMSVQAPFELIRDAIGMKSMNLVGKAQDPGKVFAEIQTFLKKSGIKINFRNYLFGEEKTDEEVESKIVEIVRKYYNPTVETVNYRAKINLKSDPDGVVAGNDTACCMPFGSGKNNIYTFNPVCSLFTLQRRGGDGVWRTVAQSVLTKDKNIGVNVAELIKKIQNPEVIHMQDIVPEELLRESKFTLACDNVELAPSVKGSELIHKQVELVYADFMAEYLSRFSVRDNLDNLQVVIGKGYSDSLTNLSQVDNLYIPSAPVGYSDKTHSTVYQLKPEKGSFVTRNVVEKNRESRGQELQTDIKGISSLTFEDSLPVAYIEGKAYRDNESLIQFLHNMENALIAKDINNATKNRANMSFKYTDKEGKVHGYLLAYEGIGSEGTEKLQGKNILYVADIASDGEVLASGRILMAALLEQYKKEYVDKGNPIPIFAQMREQTSYLIVKKQLDRYASKFGMKFTMEELGTNTVGGDVMHEVVLRLVV